MLGVVVKPGRAWWVPSSSFSIARCISRRFFFHLGRENWNDTSWMIKLSFREKSASYCDHLGNCTPPLALAVISVGSFGLSVINYLSSLYNCINSKSWNERFRSGAYILPTAVPQLIVQISILSFFGFGLITWSIWAIIVIAKCLIWKSEVKWEMTWNISQNW